ncbi:unnamed protein product [Musa banksii]
METPPDDGHADWVFRAYQTEGTSASQPLSSPVVINLGYSVMQFLEDRFVEEPPRAYYTFAFTLCDFLNQASRRQAISTVLSRTGAYGYDTCFAGRLERQLVAFCNDPVETAFNSGNGIEMIVDVFCPTSRAMRNPLWTSNASARTGISSASRRRQMRWRSWRW